MAGVQASKQGEILGLLRETAGEEAAMDKVLSGMAKRLLKEAAKPVAAQAVENKPAAKKAGARKAAASKNGGGESGHLSNTTTDHEEIRAWAEERGGKPACVQGTGGKGDIGLMRIEFPGKPNAKDDNLVEISWEDFFEKFDERGLALVYQTKTSSGQKSNFNKLIARETAKTRAAH